MTSPPLRRLAALISIAALAASLAACGSSAPPVATPNGDCGHWCGHASASVTFVGQTTTISGGGCYDGGAEGMDVRIGDWQGEGAGDYLMLIGYRPGEPTPAPTATPTDDEDEGLTPPVSGSVGGVPFILDNTATVTFTSANAGTFSGDDVNGYGPVKGSFTCG